PIPSRSPFLEELRNKVTQSMAKDARRASIEEPAGVLLPKLPERQKTAEPEIQPISARGPLLDELRNKVTNRHEQHIYEDTGIYEDVGVDKNDRIYDDVVEYYELEDEYDSEFDNREYEDGATYEYVDTSQLRRMRTAAE
ncbi:hypothetical protein, partial [Endozoicomonas sp. ONNA2]|uniref:hypothetical protein n=1 Tax=Endozoicomonas sp. ONNA2 TaxID=2828741 RepID=UPI00214982F4